MRKSILFTLVALNAVNSASHQASEASSFARMGEDSALGFLEEVFEGDTFHPMNTTLLMRGELLGEAEQSDVLVGKEQWFEDRQDEPLKKEKAEARNTVLTAKDATEFERRIPSTLGHAVSTASNAQDKKLDDWDLVEEAEEVDCVWPED